MIFQSQQSMLRFFEVRTRVDINLLRKGTSASQAADIARNQGEAAVLRAREFRAAQKALRQSRSSQK